jgi:CheY-like chemotaxis protein
MRARKPFILLADDDEDDHYSLQSAFEEVGYVQGLSFVFSGKEVIDLLQQLLPDELPTLIILDINIPVMGGVEILQFLKSVSSYQHIPVVLYSTTLPDEICQQLLAMGAHSCYVKPTKSLDLLQLVLKFRELAFNTTQ